MMMEEMGLVLEGGGMRGVFTAGAIDYMIDNGIKFPYVVAVSAGACNAISFVSGQRGRVKSCDTEVLKKYKYMGIRTMLRKGSIMDMNFLFDEFPKTVSPFDYDTFFNNSTKCLVVATNCVTGQAEYLEEKKDPERLNNICKASCSLPFVCPITYVDDMPMLDGGISDAIPVRKAMEDGYGKIIVVLTRNRGYRKKGKVKGPYFIYKKYPKLKERLRHKNTEYNEVMSFIEKEERKGSIIVIRPKKKLEVDRLEKNIKKLNSLYDHGYECAKLVFEKILNPSKED